MFINTFSFVSCKEWHILFFFTYWIDHWNSLIVTFVIIYRQLPWKVQRKIISENQRNFVLENICQKKNAKVGVRVTVDGQLWLSEEDFKPNDTTADNWASTLRLLWLQLSNLADKPDRYSLLVQILGWKWAWSSKKI